MSIEDEEDKAIDIRSEYSRPEYYSNDRDFNDTDYLNDCLSIKVPNAITFWNGVKLAASLQERIKNEVLYAYDSDYQETYDENRLSDVVISPTEGLIGLLDNESHIYLEGLAIISSSSIIIHNVPRVKNWNEEN